jgi:predicted nucleic acid-binding protein
VLLGSPRLSARDALHLAVMERRSVSTILTFDAGFDGVPGVTRLG